MQRRVESADEKMDRVKVETAEALAGAVADIASRILEPRLDPFVAGAKDSAAKLAIAAKSLDGVETKVQRKLAELDAKIEQVKVASGIQELHDVLSQTVAALDVLQKTNKATLEAVTQTARLTRAEVVRARKLAMIAAVFSVAAFAGAAAAAAFQFFALR